MFVNLIKVFFAFDFGNGTHLFLALQEYGIVLLCNHLLVLNLHQLSDLAVCLIVLVIPRFECS
jgi:hypothetical protein